MKSLSASIVILASSILITGGAQVAHNDTKTFVMAAGIALGIAGLGVWLGSLSAKKD